MPDLPFWLVFAGFIIFGYGFTSTETMQNRIYFGKSGLEDIDKEAYELGAARGRADAIADCPKLKESELICPEHVYRRIE